MGKTSKEAKRLTLGHQLLLSISPSPCSVWYCEFISSLYGSAERSVQVICSFSSNQLHSRGVNRLQSFNNNNKIPRLKGIHDLGNEKKLVRLSPCCKDANHSYFSVYKNWVSASLLPVHTKLLFTCNSSN